MLQIEIWERFIVHPYLKETINLTSKEQLQDQELQTANVDSRADFSKFISNKIMFCQNVAYNCEYLLYHGYISKQISHAQTLPTRNQ